MRRRDFIKGIVGSSVVWPPVARAQQTTRMPLVGVLTQSDSDNPDYQQRLAAFMSRMHELGWDDGRNVRIDIRWGGAATLKN